MKKSSIDMSLLNQTRSLSEANASFKILETHYRGSSYLEGAFLFIRELWRTDSDSISLQEAIDNLKRNPDKSSLGYDGACIFTSFLWGVSLHILQNATK